MTSRAPAWLSPSALWVIVFGIGLLVALPPFVRGHAGPVTAVACGLLLVAWGLFAAARPGAGAGAALVAWQLTLLDVAWTLPRAFGAMGPPTPGFHLVAMLELASGSSFLPALFTVPVVWTALGRESLRPYRMTAAGLVVVVADLALFFQGMVRLTGG